MNSLHMNLDGKKRRYERFFGAGLRHISDIVSAGRNGDLHQTRVALPDLTWGNSTKRGQISARQFHQVISYWAIGQVGCTEKPLLSQFFLFFSYSNFVFLYIFFLPVFVLAKNTGEIEKGKKVKGGFTYFSSSLQSLSLHFVRYQSASNQWCFRVSPTFGCCRRNDFLEVFCVLSKQILQTENEFHT